MAPSRPEPENALRLAGAVKAYGERRALDGLGLELAAGRWTGLIGPNGAGKTTCMLAIAGLIPLDEGRVEVAGETVSGPRPDAIGWVPQDLALYAQLTGRENLETFGALHGLGGKELRRRVDWALEWTGLDSRAGDRVGTYSGGMQRRLNIACGVLHRPRIVLLDEPTVGVDPQARERIFAMLGQLTREGAALLHSSHELGDIENSCDDLVIVDRGRAVAAGTVEEIVRSTVGEGAMLRLRLAGMGAADFDPSAAGLERRSTDRFELALGDVAAELPPLLEQLTAAGVEVASLDLRRPGLQDVFLKLTGRGLRE